MSSPPKAERRRARRARHWSLPRIENRFARYALWGAAQGFVAAFVPLGLLAGLGFQVDIADSFLSGFAAILTGVAASLFCFTLFRAISPWLVPLAFPIVSTAIPVIDTLGGNWLACGKLTSCETATGLAGLDLLIMNCWALALLTMSLPPAVWLLRKMLAERVAADAAAADVPAPEAMRHGRPRRRRGGRVDEQ
jgi:hypothetical protein